MSDSCLFHFGLFPLSGYSSLISQLIEMPSNLKSQIKYQLAHEPLPHYQVQKKSLPPLMALVLRASCMDDGIYHTQLLCLNHIDLPLLKPIQGRDRVFIMSVSPLCKSSIHQQRKEYLVKSMLK